MSLDKSLNLIFPHFYKQRKWLILILCYFLWFFFLSSASGAEKLTEDQLQAQTKEIAKTLRCAVCQSESVWESGAELATQMREIIRERLIEGQSPDQIRAYFVSRYGDFILLKPRKFGLNWLLWGGPFLMLLIGSGLLYRTLRKWVNQTSKTYPEELSEISEQERQRIQQEFNSPRS